MLPPATGSLVGVHSQPMSLQNPGRVGAWLLSLQDKGTVLRGQANGSPYYTVKLCNGWR